jgi:hypothetical protein
MQAVYRENRKVAADCVATLLGKWYAKQPVTVSGVQESGDEQECKVDVVDRDGLVLFELLVANRKREPDTIRFFLFTFSESEQKMRVFHRDVTGGSHRNALFKVITSAIADGCTFVPEPKK